MKIYVITKGSYSSYHICAVATDKEKAEKLAKIYTDRYDDAEVEEYDTEGYSDLFEGRIPYMVRFLKSGEAVFVISRSEEKERFEPEVRALKVMVEAGDCRIPNVSVKLFASSEEEAIKIAAEKRAQYLAEKNGLC